MSYSLTKKNALGLLLCWNTISASGTEVYHFVPASYPVVSHAPTLAYQDLGLISEPTEYSIPLGREACYAWHMGDLTKDVRSSSFGWATGFYPPTANQIQSTLTDSGFQNYGDERGMYLATPKGPTNTVIDIQCGEYFGASKSFYPWAYASNAVLRHGVTVKMPKAYHSNINNKKFYAVMYLRIGQRGDTWPNPQHPTKGFWLQVKIVDGRGTAIFPSTGYDVFPDTQTNHPVIDIEKSARSGLIWSNVTPMQTTEWATYKYFEYTINRDQIVAIVKKVNTIQIAGKELTTNPNDLMVFAIGTSPEVQINGSESAVMGFTFKSQYVRTEF